MGMPVEPKYSERLPYFDFHVAMPPVKPPRGRTDLICPVCGKGPVRLEPDYKATCEYCSADLHIVLKGTGESPKGAEGHIFIDGKNVGSGFMTISENPKPQRAEICTCKEGQT